MNVNEATDKLVAQLEKMELGPDRDEYLEGILDLFYEIGLSELLSTVYPDEAIAIANELINSSTINMKVYRSVMTDFILWLGTEE